MCLTTPYKILSVEGKKAIGEFRNQKREIKLELFDAKPGEYVISYGGHAIEKISEETAKKLLAEIIR